MNNVKEAIAVGDLVSWATGVAALDYHTGIVIDTIRDCAITIDLEGVEWTCAVRGLQLVSRGRSE